MNDPAAGLAILHVIVRAGATNSQYNEHCLPVLADRQITVCSLFPAEVTPPPGLTLFEGDGTRRGCGRVLRRALAFGDYDVVHVHAPASGMVALATYFRLRRPRTDLIFTVHNSWPSFRPRNRVFLRIIMALFPMVVVCGQAAHDSVPRRLRRRHGHKLAVVPNGVDVARIDRVLGDYSPPPRKHGHTVVSVNRLIPIKDPMTLLASFAEASDDDRLLFVGDGPLRREIETSADRLGIGDRTGFTGAISRDDVFKVMRRCDLFVSTSRGEGLPVAMLEAMTCGLPVIASDIAPHREIAELARLVPLVPVGDRPGFARATRRVLELSDAEREETGRRLRECVVENFSVTAMNHRYGEIYVRVTQRVGRRSLRSTDQLLPPEETLTSKMRRRLGMVALLTVLGGAGGFGFAHLQTPVFKSETTLTVGSAVPTSEEELQLRTALAVTYADFARREPVLGPVAEQGYADGWRDLQRDIRVQTGDKNPYLVQISAYAGSEADAIELSTAVADQLIDTAASGSATTQQRFLQSQLADLQAAMTATSTELQDTVRQADVATGEHQETLRAREADLRRALVDLQTSYGELKQMSTTEVTALTVTDSAWAARSPLRPTPVVLGAAGAALGLALAAGWLHLFEQGRPAAPYRAPTPATGTVWNARPSQKRGSLP